MRFLHTADWHLGRVYHGVSLLEDQACVLQDFIRIVADTRPDAVLIAGDIYDRSVPPADAVRLLDLVLTEVVLGQKVPVVVIAGNHDGPDRLGFGAGLLTRAGLTVRGPVDADVTPLMLNDAHGAVAVYALPYGEPAVVRNALEDEAIADHHAALAAQTARVRAVHPAGVRSVVVAHAFVQGGSTSESERPLSVGGTGAVGADVFAGFDYVALGHLHRPQAVGSAGASASESTRSPGCIQYSGSLLKYSFAEAGHDKSVTLVDMDAHGHCTVERLPLPPRRDLRILTGELDTLLAAAATDPARDDYILARLTDTGALLDAMGKLRMAYPNALAIERPVLLGEGSGRAAGDHRRIRMQDLFASFHEETTGLKLDAAASAALDRIVGRLDSEARQA
jgi:DNA repair protein SbcD/Mre11